jgi:hypothetical protein
MTNDYYKLSLEMLIELLKGEGYENWEKWLLEDIRLWKTDKSTEHHLRAYGGMGSFNDIIFGDNSAIGIWKIKLFGTIQTIAYSFAKRNMSILPLDEAFYAYGSSAIHGWRCQSCGDAKIKELSIENYLSDVMFPKIIIDHIKQDKFIEIANLDNIINSEKVSQRRIVIKNTIQNSAIKLSNDNKWLWTCPKCDSPQTCAYRWILTENDTKLIEADDNLSINNSQ